MHLLLPAQINADGLLPFLSLLKEPLDTEDVVVNFQSLRRVSPAALVAFVATVNRWLRAGRKVSFIGLDRCAITGYLQRMNALAACGAKLPEKFVPHNARGRFVPVRLLDLRVDEMGTEIASCVAPGGEDYDHPMSSMFDLVWYVLTETANNVRQHSRGQGYASAQVGRVEGMVRLAVADNGKGIRQSFVDAGFDWSADIEDAAAIQKAIEPRMSSKGSPTNEGVGLTLVTGLAGLTQSWLMIVSGRGVLRLKPNGEAVISELPEGGRYEGTMVALTFRQSHVHNYAKLLHSAKQQAGLLQNTSLSTKFTI